MFSPITTLTMYNTLFNNKLKNVVLYALNITCLTGQLVLPQHNSIFLILAHLCMTERRKNHLFTINYFINK